MPTLRPAFVGKRKVYPLAGVGFRHSWLIRSWIAGWQVAYLARSPACQGQISNPTIQVATDTATRQRPRTPYRCQPGC